MANRKERRKNKISTSATSEVKELELKSALVPICGVIIVILVAYALTLLAQHIGLFDERYIKPEVSAATISYDNIIAGTIFNRVDSEYYVMIADYDSDESIYVSSLGQKYSEKTDKLPLYAVDLNNDMNKGLISDTSNPSAQNTNELRINGHTLIRISNGRNVRYVEGDENIKSELGI